jgi:hypothetical protein
MSVFFKNCCKTLLVLQPCFNFRLFTVFFICLYVLCLELFVVLNSQVSVNVIKALTENWFYTLLLLIHKIQFIFFFSTKVTHLQCVYYCKLSVSVWLKNIIKWHAMVSHDITLTKNKFILNNFSLLPLSSSKDIIHVTNMMNIYKLKN